MRVALLCTAGLFLCSLPAITQEKAAPVPPGLHRAEQEGRRPLEAPIEVKRKPAELAQLRQQAAELAKLSQGVPQQIDQVAQGQLPKDLSENLKQIEKLAKRLRAELAP
jgi:hypothetical protein